MKRLKLFKEAFTQDEYYQEITQDEYYEEFDLLHQEFFTEKEIQSIITMANKYGYQCWNSNKSECISLRCKGKPFLNIYKIEDGWYYVKKDTYNEHWEITKYYKCDQFDGLEKFISDIK